MEVRHRTGDRRGRAGHGRRRIAVIAAAGLVVAMAASTVPLSASASLIRISTPVRFAPPGDVDFFPPVDDQGPDPKTTIITTDLTLRRGETRRLRDRISSTLTSGEGAEVDNLIECVDANGVKSTVAYEGGTNHPGSGAGQVAQSGTLLFTAPHDGTYTCRVRASTSDGQRRNYHATAVQGVWPGGTWLEISSADEVGAHWWDTATCNSPGDAPGCVYLGGRGDLTTFNIFENRKIPDPNDPLYVWTALDGATTADVTADVQVTTCSAGGSSCCPTAGPTCTPHRGSSGQSVVRTHLEFTQLLPSGAMCRVNRTPDADHTISTSVHHLPISYRLASVQISPTCLGSRQFTVRVVMTWRSGNPVKIDQGSVRGFRSSTNATAINSVIATTATVPGVIGVDEGNAGDAVRAAGLRVGEVSRVVSPAPAGTVITQNAPAGTVEPSDSPVDLSVSLGDGSAPNVFYRAGDGATVTGRVNGTGQLVEQHSVGPFATGWTHITSAGGGRLLFYRAGDGAAVTGRADGTGQLVEQRSVGPLATGWTQFVPAGGGRLLLYRTGDGVAMTVRVDTAGGLVERRSVGPLMTGWTHLAPAGGTRLLFYRAGDGLGVTGSVDAGGAFVTLPSVSAALTGSTVLADPNDSGQSSVNATDPTVAVPNVYGMTPADAQAALVAADLAPNAGGTEPTDDRALNRKVVDTAPAAGTRIAPGTTVSYATGIYTSNHCGPSPC